MLKYSEIDENNKYLLMMTFPDLTLSYHLSVP